MKGELAGTAEDCGCAPTEGERRSFLVPVSRRTALGLAAFGAVALGSIGGPLVPAAFAATYPSWDDVQNALANEAVKAGEVARIENLIASLTAEVERTRIEAEARADEYYVAQQDFYDAAYRADELQSQADEQAALALESAQKAGRVAAQLYRNGGDDTSLELFFAGSAANADDLLARLGTMDKMVERNQAVYSDAIKARDSAQSLSDQAVVARTERDRLQQVAEQKMIESQAAADAAQAALDEQQQHLGELEAQLEALRNTTTKTIAEYEAGVEAERLAALERQRQADLQAQQLAGVASVGGGRGGAGGVIVGGGWARPSSGVRTSGYGPRTRQCGTGYCSSGFHRGVDLSTGCGAAIYAAHAGVVDYAGYNGGYGNYIRIDHGAATGTGYAHIMQGGIRVSRGQWVGAGQLIALEGNTGNSFGCHLHFETYQNGYPVNPIDFMAARGVSV